MSFIPLRDRYLVRKLDDNKVSKGGIIIPDTAQGRDQAWTGEVVAVGKGKRLDNGRIVEPSARPGQKIVIGKYHGTEVAVADERFYIVPEDDVLGIVEE